MKEDISDQVALGRNCRVAETAVVGLIPGRRVADLRTVIGDGAVIRSGTVIYAGVTIGANLETGHNVVIREENRIGANFSIWNSSVVDYGCTIGRNVKLHNHVYIAQYTTIEDDVFIAPGVVAANDPHPVCTECMRGPTIRSGARIGINATLLPGITVGRHALVGAGSVVVRDVEPYAVVAGNPAVPIGTVDDLRCRAGFDRPPYAGGSDVKSRKSRG